MGTQKLKAAVISAGMIANSGHIPAYKAFSQDVSLEAVCDLNASAARDTALHHDIPRWYSDVAAMLEEVHPDLVSVCTPNSTHKGLVAQALKAGANVICEKPLTLHYADTVELYALAEKLGKQLVVCQTSRFQRAYFAARDYIADGVLGNIYYAEIDRIRRRGVPSWGTFHRKAASGGGALADIGIHALDAMLWMLGSPQVSAVSGFTSDRIIHSERGVIYDLKESGAFSGVHTARRFDPAECDVEEFASGSLRTDAGISLNFKVAWAANFSDRNNMMILGDKSGLTLPELKLYGTLGENQTDFSPRLFGLGEYDGRPFAGHYYLIRHVIGVLNGTESLMITPQQVINTAATLEMFYRSSELGREVRRSEIM